MIRPHRLAWSRTRAFSRCLVNVAIGIPLEELKRSSGTSSRKATMYYVYVLENNQGRHYIGSCDNVAIRLRRHNQNSIRSTKHKGPFKVIYKEQFNTRSEARQRENHLKQYKGSAAFKRLINR